MKVMEFIAEIRAALYVIFYTGVTFKVVIILQKGQTEENYPTKTKIQNLLKVAIIGTCSVGLVEVIKGYFI